MYKDSPTTRHFVNVVGLTIFQTLSSIISYVFANCALPLTVEYEKGTKTGLKTLKILLVKTASLTGVFKLKVLEKCRSVTSSFFFLSLYLSSDSQESDGGANT